MDISISLVYNQNHLITIKELMNNIYMLEFTLNKPLQGIHNVMNILSLPFTISTSNNIYDDYKTSNTINNNTNYDSNNIDNNDEYYSNNNQ